MRGWYGRLFRSSSGLFVPYNERVAEDPGNAYDIDAFAQTVARNVRRMREIRAYSLSELARRSGCGKSTLSRLESGSGNPSMETLLMLARALDVPVSTLVDQDEPRVQVIRADQWTALTLEDGHLLAREIASSDHPTRYTLLIAEWEVDRPLHVPGHAPGTVERLFVLQGRLEAGPAVCVHTLAKDEGLVFDADVPHTYCARAPGTISITVHETP